ncbi:MAG: PVC-type heme-binding CxxCH protein [Verrucomicrobiaceae bacterium]
MRPGHIPFVLLFPWLSLSALDFPSTPPVEPQNAAKTFHVLDGFEMQLIAAEPLITDPVAITYDADGRAYVCEMNDYPYTDKATHKPSQENPTDQPIGKVRLLTDTDGDGIFDKATVFADGLSWPTGAACWKGGIFVTATPDVWYLKDTNDDGVADVRQKVFTGFKKLNVQAVMNNPIWGLDHRIYIAGGSNGGEIQRVPGSESVMPLPKDFKPLPIKRNDFSFDPSTGDVRLESGGARFGNTFDDWGNRFLCNIRNPCQHVVLPYRYLARNPYLVVPSALNDCAEAGDQLPVYRTSPPEPWREFRAKRWVQEGSHLPKSELVGAGVVTSSSGITVYRGDAYPKEYRDFAFVADVAGNLFYRMKLVPDGVTFKAVQVDGNKNFCTSDDLWFRPVNFANAPDGCLHVCDMYREVIEHPWSIPDDIHAAVDLLRGRDRGRIWRLAPRSGPHSPSAVDSRTWNMRTTPKLSSANTSELVALLDHPNAWHRETAQRLLFERQDKSAVEPLQKLVQNATTSQGKSSAIYTLSALSQLSNGVVLIALARNDNKVRNAALAAISSWKNVSPHVEGAVWDLAGATSPEVRMSVSFLLGGVTQVSSESLKQLVRSSMDEPWLRQAILSLHPGHSAIAGIVALNLPQTPGMVDFVHQSQFIAGSYRVTSANGVEDIDARNQFLSFCLSELQTHKETHAEAVEAGIIGLTQGLAKQSLRVADVADKAELKAWVVSVAQRAANEVVDKQVPLQSRLRAAHLLPVGVYKDSQAAIISLLAPDVALEIQLAALEALGSYREPAVADMLIDAWPKMTPALRDKATTILLSRTDRIAKLLDAIEAKKITPAQLSVAAKATLGRQKTPAMAERIAKLIGDGSSSNRKEVIEKYLVAMGIKERGTPSPNSGGRSPPLLGDAARGSKVYETACMVCHKFADKGNDVGPHLGTIKAWTAEQLVTNILDPNREVSPSFALYIIETNDGRTLSGLIASETAGNLTLKRADGGTDTVLRSEIKSLTSPGISLMPEGLEAAINPQQMADLIAYLKAP